jgi:hypothetical protein
VREKLDPGKKRVNWYNPGSRDKSDNQKAYHDGWNGVFNKTGEVDDDDNDETRGQRQG